MSGGEFPFVLAIVPWDADGEGPAPPQLVAGGAFTHAGGLGVNYIALWNGVAWSRFLGTTFNGAVLALATRNQDGAPASRELVAGGYFTAVSGVTMNRIARWNGSIWRPFGDGMNNSVSTLTTWDPDGDGPDQPSLVAGGYFTTAEGRLVGYIARWDGSAWQPMGGGLSGNVTALAMWDGDGGGSAPPRLLAAGQFREADGLRVEGLAWYYFGGAQDPFIDSGPYDSSACIDGSATFSIRAAGARPFMFQWEIGDPSVPGEWRALADGVLVVGGIPVADVSGATSSELTVCLAAYGVRFGPADFRCVVDNTCGSATSNMATLTTGGTCPADFNCDDSPDVADFFDYLTAFFTADPRGDFNRDGALNSQDFFDFLTVFFTGC